MKFKCTMCGKKIGLLNYLGDGLCISCRTLLEIGHDKKFNIKMEELKESGKL